MGTRNVNLPEHYDSFVSDCVDSGRYQNASEVVRAGLRLLEAEQQAETAKLKALRAIATQAFEALDRGESVAVRSPKAFLKRIARKSRSGHSTRG